MFAEFIRQPTLLHKRVAVRRGSSTVLKRLGQDGLPFSRRVAKW